MCGDIKGTTVTEEAVDPGTGDADAERVDGAEDPDPGIADIDVGGASWAEDPNSGIVDVDKTIMVGVENPDTGIIDIDADVEGVKGAEDSDIGKGSKDSLACPRSSLIW